MNVPAAADVATRLQFAVRIAAEAGQRLVALRASGRWPDEAMLGDVGDQAADGYLQGSLRAKFPDDGILSEETADVPERLQRRWTWVVDPLDGTKEYSQGRHDWAVHVGLAFDGAVVAGALGLPTIARVVAGTCLPGDRHAVVHGVGGDWPTVLPAADTAPPDGRMRLVVSRSHTPELVHRVAKELGGAELIPCGSVGFKVAMLLFGKADAYVHKRGLKEWDTCAPEAAARGAGFEVFRLDGSPLRYNRPDPRCDEIVVCRPSLRERLLAVLAAR